MDPFHQSALDPDEAWGSAMQTACSCGRDLPLWQKRCPACRAKNRFAKLLGRRKQAERWLGRQIEQNILPTVRAADLLPEQLERYERMLREVVRRPLPERQKKEDMAAYLKRVLSFFPPMFKTTAPSVQAREMDDRLGRSARAMRHAAGLASVAVIQNALGQSRLEDAGTATEEEILHLRRDLASVMTPYLEALKILLMYHNRMVGAWAPVRPILQRPIPESKLKGAWNKVRSMVHPVGQLLNFGTAIWSEPVEREQLQRFESEIMRFLEQVERFSEQTAAIPARRRKQEQTWRLSWRRYLLWRINASLAAAAPDQRTAMVDRFLSQKGVGAWWWRLLFSKKSSTSDRR